MKTNKFHHYFKLTSDLYFTQNVLQNSGKIYPFKKGLQSISKITLTTRTIQMDHSPQFFQPITFTLNNNLVTGIMNLGTWKLWG